MSESGLNLNSSSKLSQFPRGKSHKQTKEKITVGLYLSKNLVEKAKKNKLNLSKILEEALNSILSYVEAQKTENASATSSLFLSRGSFQKESRVPRAGFEPATCSLIIEKKRLKRDLEDFKLFCLAKLDLSEQTSRHYVRRVRAFLEKKSRISERDIQTYIYEAKQKYAPDYVSNIISALKAYFRDYKGLKWMDGYKHPSGPLKMKEEIEPWKVKRFIEAIDDIGVKCFALFLATSGLRKNEVWNLRKSDVTRELRAIIPNCHSGKTKRSGISFYNEEAEEALLEFEKSMNPWQSKSDKLLPISKMRLYFAWKTAKEKSGIHLKPKDLRDFFSQEMGKALIPDRFIDIFQGRSPRNVLAKHYTPQGIKLLREIYDKANLKVLANG